MQAARARMRKFKDLRVQVRNVQTLNEGSAAVDINLSIRGPDLALLNQYSEQLREAAVKIPGIVDVDTTLANRKPELQVRIDRDKANQFGISVEQIARALRTTVGGEIVSTWKEADDQFDVWLRAEVGDRATREAVERDLPAAREGGAEAGDRLVLGALQPGRGIDLVAVGVRAAPGGEG